MGLHRLDETREDAVMDGMTCGDPPVPLGRGNRVASQGEIEMVNDRRLEAFSGFGDVRRWRGRRFDGRFAFGRLSGGLFGHAAEYSRGRLSGKLRLEKDLDYTAAPTSGKGKPRKHKQAVRLTGRGQGVLSTRFALLQKK